MIKLKTKIIAILLLLIILSFSFARTVEAFSSDNDFIKIDGKTITKKTTIEEVNKMFGNPKIETQSPFGGKIYSYYEDDYNYYLFLETDADGRIMAYGGIGGNFQTISYGEGSNYPFFVSHLSGTALYDIDTNKVYAGMQYADYAYLLEDTYWENYKKDSATYLYGLQKHSIAANKVLAKRNGYEFPQNYTSEDIFYLNEQLKYNGSNLEEYAKNTGKTQAIYSVRSGKNMELYSHLLNPISFAGEMESYVKPSSFKYALYDIEVTDYESERKKVSERYIFIDPSFLDERKVVPLSEEEQEKLEAAKEQNRKYIEKLEKINGENFGFFEEEPQYENLPLKAGKIREITLEAVTDFLNIARAGIGIDPVKANMDIADAAQHKAVLVYYNSEHGYESGHYPEQPEGVSDEFFQKAQSYTSENLYNGDSQRSIMNALNDGYGDPVTCAHRYNLLYPGHTEFGVGHAGEGISWAIQGCHKLSGNREFDTELVAWPSNGIMPINHISGTIGNWTAQFYKNYSVTEETEVTIECLNTGATYEITKENSGTNGKFLRTTGSRLVTFRDDNLTYENGDVFKITLHNMKNDATGEVEDYTYRSVFHIFSDSSQDEEVTDIELDKESIELNMGGSTRVLAKAKPDNAGNKLMTFTSENENIAKVRQDGTITGVNEGATTITVTCGMVSKTITVKVNEYLKGDINGDGEITTSDLSYGLKRLTGTPITEDEIKRGDITDDGEYTTADLSKLLRYLTGVINKL